MIKIDLPKVSKLSIKFFQEKLTLHLLEISAQEEFAELTEKTHLPKGYYDPATLEQKGLKELTK